MRWACIVAGKTNPAIPACRAASIQRVADLEVRGAQLRPHELHAGDDGQCDHAGQKRIFDRRRAVFATDKVMNPLHLIHLGLQGRRHRQAKAKP
jgi:hypothetical protein